MTCRLGVVRQSFEEEGWRRLKNIRELLHSAGAYSVGALFVFLNLLKCEADGVAKFFLAHAKHEPSHTDALSHMLVSGIWGLRFHRAEFFSQCLSALRPHARGKVTTLRRRRAAPMDVFLLAQGDAEDVRAEDRRLWQSVPINMARSPAHLPKIRL